MVGGAIVNFSRLKTSYRFKPDAQYGRVECLKA